MSNITIVGNEAELKDLPWDVLVTLLEKYAKDGVFIGEYRGPGRPSRRTR